MHCGGMRTRHVVVIAFPGVQPLDAVGPIEVFAGASRVAAAQGRAAAYRVSLASTGGRTVWSDSGVGLSTVPLPDPKGIDTLVLAGGNGNRAAREDGELLTWIRRAAPQLPPGRHRVHRYLPRGRSRTARRPARHHPLGQCATAGRGIPGVVRRCRSDLHP